MLPSRYFNGANDCTNTNHCFDSSLIVTRQHYADCRALIYRCEKECQKGCYTRSDTEAQAAIERRASATRKS